MRKTREIAPIAKPNAPSTPSDRRRTEVRAPSARPVRHRSDFDRWIDVGADLAAHYGRLTESLEKLNGENPPPAALLEAESLLARWPEDQLAGAVSEFIEARSWYERDEIYDEDRSGDLVISAKFVAERIGIMLTAIPSAAPPNAAAFVRLLIEEVLGVGASATQVEFATRQLARTQTRAPSLAALLRALRAAQTPEWSDAFALDDGTVNVLWARGSLERTVAIMRAAFAAQPRLPGPERKGGHEDA
jgi:hypothetical protein